MDQLRAMEIFVEVARLRSFSEAGRRLGLTRAMVSKHILQLEDRLQARLLHRSTREVSLTDAGQAYLAPCTAAVEQAAEVLDYRNKPGVIVVITDADGRCRYDATCRTIH